MIHVTFECGGCFKKEPGTKWISQHFQSFSGRSYGIGSYVRDTIEDVTPEGWIAFDPYTQCTYCPECWASIVTDIVPAQEADAQA